MFTKIALFSVATIFSFCFCSNFSDDSLFCDMSNFSEKKSSDLGVNTVSFSYKPSDTFLPFSYDSFQSILSSSNFYTYNQDGKTTLTKDLDELSDKKEEKRRETKGNAFKFNPKAIPFIPSQSFVPPQPSPYSLIPSMEVSFNKIDTFRELIEYSSNKNENYSLRMALDCKHRPWLVINHHSPSFLYGSTPIYCILQSLFGDKRSVRLDGVNVYYRAGQMLFRIIEKEGNFVDQSESNPQQTQSSSVASYTMSHSMFVSGLRLSEITKDISKYTEDSKVIPITDSANVESAWFGVENIVSLTQPRLALNEFSGDKVFVPSDFQCKVHRTINDSKTTLIDIYQTKDLLNMKCWKDTENFGSILDKLFLKRLGSYTGLCPIVTSPDMAQIDENSFIPPYILAPEEENSAIVEHLSLPYNPDKEGYGTFEIGSNDSTVLMSTKLEVYIIFKNYMNQGWSFKVLPGTRAFSSGSLARLLPGSPIDWVLLVIPHATDKGKTKLYVTPLNKQGPSGTSDANLRKSILEQKSLPFKVRDIYVINTSSSINNDTKSSKGLLPYSSMSPQSSFAKTSSLSTPQNIFSYCVVFQDTSDIIHTYTLTLSFDAVEMQKFQPVDR